jgi:hypothetical protein
MTTPESNQAPDGPQAAQNASTPSPVIASPDAHNVTQSPEKSTPSSPLASQFVDKSTRDKTKTTDSIISRTTGSLRRASVTLLESDMPTSMMASAGAAAATAPSLADIRRGSFGGEGWSAAQQQQATARRPSEQSMTRRLSSSLRPGAQRQRSSELEAVIQETTEPEHHEAKNQLPTIISNSTTTKSVEVEQPSTEPATLEPQEKLPWTTTWAIGLKASIRWVFTIKGFLITVYGLNVVAWGGMLFLLLCNAAPAMCSHTKDGCNDVNSPRRKWMEIDQQILNAFFCLTGFGLAPWRIRDTWLLVTWRGYFTKDLKKREIALRKLAGIHKSWFRLQGCEDWKVDAPVLRNVEDYENDISVPLPIKKHLNPPITGVRAPPSAYWKMDFLVWCNIWNTIFQAFLAAFMWAYNRYECF